MTEEQSEVVRVQETSLIEKYRSEILASIFGIPVILLFLQPVLSGTADTTRYVLNSFAFVFLFAAMALTLNLEVGYLGLPNFGKVAFIMIGAYSYAMVEDSGFSLLGLGTVLTGIIMAIVVTGLSGILLTLPTLRLKEDYFAILTIVAGEILRLIANNEETFGGHSGFAVTRVVFNNFDPDQLVGGKLLGIFQFLTILVNVILAFIVFQYYYPKFSSIYEDKQKVVNYSLSKSIVVASIFTVFSIFINYLGVFGGQSISLDVFSLGFVAFLLLAKFILGIMNYSDKMSASTVFGIYLIFPILSLISGLFQNDLGVSRLNNANWYFMLLTGLFLAIVYIVMEHIYYSPFGRALRAIREDDTSAVSIGKGLFDFRLRGLIISNALTGFVAAAYAWLLTTTNPQAFLPILTFQLYIMVIIGGTGNNKGVIYGALVVQLLIQTTRRLGDLDIYYPFFTRTDILNFGRQVNPFNLALIIVGIVLIIFLIYAPEGIFPEKKNINEQYKDLLYLNDKPEETEDVVYNLQKMILKATGTKVDLETKVITE